jgi:hypothetical protein
MLQQRKKESLLDRLFPSPSAEKEKNADAHCFISPRHFMVATDMMHISLKYRLFLNKPHGSGKGTAS